MLPRPKAYPTHALLTLTALVSLSDLEASSRTVWSDHLAARVSGPDVEISLYLPDYNVNINDF